MASDKSNLVLERLEKRTRTKSSRYASSEFVDGKGLSPQADSVGNKKQVKKMNSVHRNSGTSDNAT